jgi:uncharacterized protein
MLEKNNFHVFRNGDRHFFFLTLPVALFSIDAETYAVLRKVEQDQALDTGAESARWREVNLFASRYMECAKPAKPVRAPSDITDKVVALYLFVCQECNLKCAYCYGNEGEYGQRGRMTPDVMNSAFERFFSAGQGLHYVTFFGGEPLMNFPLMEKTAKLAQEYRDDGKADVNMCIVTNGTLYNPKIDAFFREHIRDVTFSLDGPKALNDAQRVAKSGDSVYDLAEENIRKLTADAPFGWSFRTIVTRAGCDQVEDIYKHMETFNPGGIGIVDVDVPKDSPLHIDDVQYTRFLEQIVAVNRRGIGSILEGDAPVAFEYPFYILYYFVSRSHALYHCNAGTNLLAVTAEGDVYPCHRFVGIKEFNMGNVADPELKTSERYQSIRNQFVNATVDNREGCRDCWARYLCGGSCAKYAYAEHGSINPPVARHCQYIKTIVEELMPDLVAVMEQPEQRRKLINRLGEAVRGSATDSRAMGKADVA